VAGGGGGGGDAIIGLWAEEWRRASQD